MERARLTGTGRRDSRGPKRAQHPNGITGSSLNTGNGWKSQNTLKRAIAGSINLARTFCARHNWTAHTRHNSIDRRPWEETRHACGTMQCCLAPASSPVFRQKSQLVQLVSYAYTYSKIKISEPNPRVEIFYHNPLD